MTQANPLLDFSDLPRFADIRVEHVTPAITTLLTAAQSAVERAAASDSPATWQALEEEVEQHTERLGRAWGVVNHLNAVADSAELREAHGANLAAVTEFWSSLGQNLALFDKYKLLSSSTEFSTLSPARKKIIANALRGFKLGGAELPAEQKPRFAEIQEQLATLSKTFSDNVLDATNAYALYVETAQEVAGIPEDALAAARHAAEKDGKTGWKFTLHFPSLFPVLQYANQRSLRETLYHANVTRASELGPQYGQGKSEWDNTGNMLDILRLRHEAAVMLGYNNYAEVSLAPKMAQSPAQVLTFMDEIAAKARPFAEKDLAELRAFAASELGLPELAPWDLAWASEKLREKRYAFSEQEVKAYFPEPKVMEGLFRVIQTLYGVRIVPQTATLWHTDAKLYRVENALGECIANFYTDLYAREGKRGGAWMDDVRGRKRLSDAAIQTPAAYLICNFTPPVGNKPAQFTHDEVITLFHEFGHGLHHMLTRIEDLGVSGINGVEWDAVELPSQFMENFCWEWDVLSHMTAHFETGEALPRALYDKMLAAKNFQNGLGTLRQVVFSSFDMHLHSDFKPAGSVSVLDLSRRINDQIHVVPQITDSRWPNTFSHIFAGGYAAGYYSYKWAEVLSADAYEAFEEAAKQSGTVLDTATGTRFCAEVLSVGGSRTAMESFKAFRGREPSIDALLRHGGMAA